MKLRDIIEVAADLGIDLEPAGGDEWKALCHLHGDTAPSLFINETKQVFKCHGCGAKGNAFTLAKLSGADPTMAYAGGDSDVEVPPQPTVKIPEASSLGERYCSFGLLVDKLDPAVVYSVDVAAALGQDERLSQLLERVGL